MYVNNSANVGSQRGTKICHVLKSSVDVYECVWKRISSKDFIAFYDFVVEATKTARRAYDETAAFGIFNETLTSVLLHFWGCFCFIYRQ